MEDALDRAVDQAGEPVRALGAPRDIEGAEEEEEQEPRRGLEPRRQEAHSKVTQQPRAPSKARVLQSTADGKGEARSLEGSTPRMTSGAAYCEARPHPSWQGPESFPAPLKQGTQLRWIVVFFPDLDPRKTCPVLKRDTLGNRPSMS